MKLFLNLIFRAIHRRPLRTILSMLGIMIGVAGILALDITNQASLASISDLFVESSGKTDLIILPAFSNASLNTSNLRSAEMIAGVTQVSPLLKEMTVLAQQNGGTSLDLTFFGLDSDGLILHGIDPVTDSAFRDYSIIDGRFLEDSLLAYEVVLVDTYAKNESIVVGDLIMVLSPNGFETLRVVGLMEKRGPGLTNNGSFGVLPIETAQRMFNRKGEFDQIDLIIDNVDNNKIIEELRLEIENRLGNSVSVTYPAGQGQRMTQMLSNYQIGLNFLSGIALFVGAFLIYNTFAMNVVERTREFGMLRTIGMTRRQLVTQVIVEAVILGTLGSIFGIILGLLSAQGLTKLMGSLLGTDLNVKMSLSLGSLIKSMLIGMGVTSVSAIIPSIQAGRVSPMTAIRIRGQNQEKWIFMHGWKIGLSLITISTAILIWNPFPYDQNFVLGSLTVFLMFGGITLIISAIIPRWEKLSRPLMKLIYGNSGLIGSRNIERSRSRTTLTVTALLIGVSMILNVRIMTASFSKDLKTWINGYIGGDIYIHSSVPLRSDMAYQLSGVEGVEVATPIQYLSVEFREPTGEKETIQFMGIDPSTYQQVTNFVFSNSDIDVQSVLSKLNQGGLVLVSSVMAEKYSLNPGDDLWIYTSSGYKSFEIAEVIVDFYNQGLVVTGNWHDLKRYFRTNEISTILVKTMDGYDVSDVISNIDYIYGDRYQLTMESNASIRTRISNLMTRAFSMFDVMAVLAVLIASLGIVNTLMMNILERMQEIGMLRAIGMTRYQVIKMVLAEAGIMGLFGGLIGLGFGILLSRIFLTGMAVMSGYKLDFIVPINGIISALIVSLIVSQLAAIQPAIRAARLDILEAIQFE